MKLPFILWSLAILVVGVLQLFVAVDLNISFFISIIFILSGFLLLVKGADFLVEGASAFAKGFGVSDLVIGLTIVSLGTSAPELVVNVGSSFKGESDFVYGNVLGSNIFNSLFTLGLAGLIYPLKVLKNTGRREIPISIFIVIIVLLMSNDSFFWAKQSIPNGKDGILSRFDGAILLTFFAVFLYYVFRNSKSEPSEGDTILKMPFWKTLLLMSLGLCGLIFGGNWVLDGSIAVAKSFNLSERIIGLTILAVGTSLPEMATSVVAAMKKNSDIAVGNVVGSNIFNVLAILGLSSFIFPTPFSSTTNFDIYFLIGSTVLIFGLLFIGSKPQKGFYTLGKLPSLMLILIYVAYTCFLVLQEVYKNT
jgi:cation:H+ antiporter